ncbi:hypothetical protein [Roseomonas xinghualingensis]
MTTFYVSAAAVNGIPAGNDLTGDGSFERPFATIDKANAAAADGDTIKLNDGVYSPAKTLQISKAISIESVTDYGATIRAVEGQSRVVGISEDQGGTVTFGKIIIDGANTATTLITVNDQPSAYTLHLDGTRLVNPTSYGIQGTSAGTKVNLDLDNVEFTATSALSMINIPALMAGKVSVTGGSVDIADVWRAGFGGIATIDADAAGTTVEISGVSANLHATGTDAAGTGGIYYGIRLTDVQAPLIEYNQITQTGISADQTGYTVLVTYEKTNPIDISGGIIRYNELRNDLDGTAGKIILVGHDSDPGAAARNHANGFEIYGNSGFGDEGAEAAKLHGILVGWQDGAKVFDNALDYTSLAYVLKGMSGETLVFDNTDTRTTSKSLYQKGGDGVQFLYNTSYLEADFNPDAINIGDAGGGQYAAKNAVVVGNNVVYLGAPDSFLTVWDGSTAANISGNNYYSALGNSSQAWIYQGTSYKTIESWQADVESSATYSDNVVVGQGAILAAIGLSGQMLQMTGMVNGVQTYEINFIYGVASTTTFAIGNFGVAGAAAISGLVDVDFTGTGSSSLSGSGLTDHSYSSLGSGDLLTFTISYDGLSALGGQVIHIYGNYTNVRPIDIKFNSIALPPPVISGGTTVSATDMQTVSPFASMTITDADTSSRTHTVRVSASEAGTGTFTELAGFVSDGAGGYTFTGTVAEVNAALQGLRFTPTSNQVSIGGTVTTQFTVTYDNGEYTISNNATQTIVESVNDQPLLSGIVVEQAVSDQATLQPFATSSYLDPDQGQTTTLTIALDKVTRGTFTNLNGFVDNSDGTYTFVGTATAADAALRGLVFTPARHQAQPGQSILAKLTITHTDGVSPVQTNVAYLKIVAENTAPELGGAAASSITDVQTVKPFLTMTVTDLDKGAIVTVTVALDNPAKGSLTNLGGFVDNGDGTYSFTGAPGTVQSALRQLVFDPVDHRLPAQQTDTTRFTVTVSDGTATTSDTTTAVTVTHTASNTPTNGNDELVGTAQADVIDGLGGNDLIRGLGGHDILYGGDGDDILDGGTGADRMEGGAGNDTYIVDHGGDLVVELEGAGTDLVQSSISFSLAGLHVENLTLTGTAAINGTGNSLDNVLTGNSAANRLDGGAGADRMEGGKGNDTYIVDDVGDVVIEWKGQGIDLVLSSVSFSMAGQHVDNLTLTGTAAINGTGNSLDNVLTGNSAANRLDGGTGNDILYGGDGDDTLIGGAGADRLVGGAGADVFQYLTPNEGGDTIDDFVSGVDRLQISRAGFGGGLSGTALTADQFTANSAGLATLAGGQFVYETDTGKLWWDADGTGTGEQIVIATFSGQPSLAATDFTLIA